MRLVYGPTATRVRGNKFEKRAVRALLSQSDPEAHFHPLFNERDDDGNRLWDGIHRFFESGPKGSLRVPTGLIRRVLHLFDEEEAEYRLEGFPDDLGPQHVPADCLEGVELRPYQTEGVAEALRQMRGVIRVPPRGGKTEMQIAVATLLAAPSLLLVGRESLMQQHWERFRERGLRDVGRYGAGHDELGHTHVIAMAQTLGPALDREDPEAVSMLESRVLLQADEAHHLGSAESWFNIFGACPAHYRLGWSGTPHRDHAGTGLFHPADWWLEAATGPMIFQVTSQFLREGGWLVPARVRMVPIEAPRVYTDSYTTAYREGIAQHESRNARAVALAVNLANKGHRVLVLVTRIGHGKDLLKAVEREGVSAAFSVGAQKVHLYRRGAFRTEKYSAKILRAFRKGHAPVLIGSTIYDEGLDLPYLTRLVNASGQKSPIVTIQRAYRAMTPTEGKKRVVIYDFDDRHHRTLAEHSEARVHAYELEGLEVQTGPVPSVAELG